MVEHSKKEENTSRQEVAGMKRQALKTMMMWDVILCGVFATWGLLVVKKNGTQSISLMEVSRIYFFYKHSKLLVYI